MSMFRTLQGQSRIVTLFAHDLEVNKMGTAMLDYLRTMDGACGGGKHRKHGDEGAEGKERETDGESTVNIEIVNRFPTQDQLLYMMSFDREKILCNQVRNLDRIIKLPTFDPVFGSSLNECIKNQIWNAKSSLWVDWERQQLGNSIRSIRRYMASTQK